MKLNPDCIRDILLVIEEKAEYGTVVTFTNECMHNLDKKYSRQEILYHLRQCEWADLLKRINWDAIGDCAIADLSPKGHEFLANIHKNDIWNGVKNIAGKVGSVSLSALVQIASNVVTELIKTQFAITSV